MGLNVLIEPAIEQGQRAIDEAYKIIKESFTKPYKRIIELRNKTDHKLSLVTGEPTSFDLTKGEFTNGPDAIVEPQSVEIFGVHSTRNLLGPDAIHGWCTYTCKEFDVQLIYVVLNDVSARGRDLVAVRMEPPGTVNAWTDFWAHIKTHTDFGLSTTANAGGKKYGAKIIGTSGTEAHEFTLVPI